MPGTKEERTEVLDKVPAFRELLDGEGKRERGRAEAGVNHRRRSSLWWSWEVEGPTKGQLEQVPTTYIHMPHTHKTPVQSPHNCRTPV